MTYPAIVQRVKRMVVWVPKPQTISRLKVLALRYRVLRRLFRLRYFGLNGLDQKIEEYTNLDDGYFVELGANDGVNQSNTLYFEWFRGWRGLLIEPHPKNFSELKKNRSDTNVFKRAACVGPEYSNRSVQLMYSNLMTSTLGIKSDITDPINHAMQGSKFGIGKNYEFEAPAFTLNQLLAEADAPSLIDLLSLDVEGAELEILKGINHSTYRFRYLCIESRNPTELRSYLEKEHYQFVSRLSSHDYLFSNVA